MINPYAIDTAALKDLQSVRDKGLNLRRMLRSQVAKGGIKYKPGMFLDKKDLGVLGEPHNGTTGAGRKYTKVLDADYDISEGLLDNLYGNTAFDGSDFVAPEGYEWNKDSSQYVMTEAATKAAAEAKAEVDAIAKDIADRAAKREAAEVKRIEEKYAEPTDEQINLAKVLQARYRFKKRKDIQARADLRSAHEANEEFIGAADIFEDASDDDTAEAGE